MKKIRLSERKLIRMSEQDMEILKQRSKEQEMTESEYIRTLIKSRNINKEIIEHLSRLNYEINHIGNNVNQLAKKWNSGYYGSDDVVKLLTYMKQTKQLVQEMVNYCN